MDHAAHGAVPRGNPDLSVQLDPEPRTISFGDGIFDCAIRSGTKPPPELDAEELFRVGFAPMCSPQFLARHPTLRTVADLAGVPRIMPNDPWWREFIEPPNGSGRGPDMGAQVLDGAAAIGGQGVALLTPLFWRDDLADGRLVRPFPNWVDSGQAYWLVYPRERAGWSKIRRFSRWLHNLCDEAAVGRAGEG